MVPRRLKRGLGVFLAICNFCCQLAEAQSLPASVDFNEQVRPILTKQCSGCHGGVKQAAGISFTYEDDLLSLIEPGSAENSYFMERIVTEDESYRMPPPDHGPRLSDVEIALLEKWIDQGAKWSKPWAYRVPQRSELPSVSNPQWCRKSIDHFVLAKLDELGASPAKSEQPDRWLRRVSLDLIGLPPTPSERAIFLSDLQERGDDAYSAAVDRLLSSDRFGERWASVWFDLVRYADSRGLSEDSPRDIWKYRDWVITALNQDLPFDEFTRKQIAGDLFPDPSIEDRLATAVHRLTASNEEGGTDDEEFRVAANVDRVSTVWQVWQGTTMNCVQCHDHPYDPIRHEDFYRFMAYFNNTADCDLENEWPTLQVPLDESKYEQAARLDREIRDMREQIWLRNWQIAHQDADWTSLRIAKVTSSNATRLIIDSVDERDEYRTVGTVARGPAFTVELSLPSDARELTGIRLTILPLNEASALKDAEVGFVMSKIDVALKSSDGSTTQIRIGEVIGDEPFPYSAPQKSLQENNEGFGAYTRIYHPRSLVLLPTAPISPGSESKLVIKVKYGVFDLAAFSLVGRRGYFSVSSDTQLTALLEDQNRLQQVSHLNKLIARRSEVRSIATPVLAERPNHLARPTHRFDRGLFLTKAERVEPGVPASISESRNEVGDRLALADWLVADANPLTARVTVNRFWARLFGTGLVLTEGDFGAAGDWPSHPQLLDDLAVRFREDYKWSVKQLLREIVLSSTYRQSSRFDSDFHRSDPQNRWLARGPRHALPAETIRDQMLAISGLLNLDKDGGPPVYPPIPDGVWKVRRGKWETHPVGSPDRYRRSVYTYVKRSIPYPMFSAFDAPSRDVCISSRLRSNTPLQTLMLLNDEAAHECAVGLANRMANQSNAVEQQIEFGFKLATCREPSRNETARLHKLYKEVLETADAQSALESVATVLLNLDEVVSK